MNGVHINNMRYADHTILMATSEEGLQRLLVETNENSELKGLSISCKKMKCMVISMSEPPPACTLKIWDTSIQQVDSFNCFYSSESGTLTAETCNNKPLKCGSTDVCWRMISYIDRVTNIEVPNHVQQEREPLQRVECGQKKFPGHEIPKDYVSRKTSTENTEIAISQVLQSNCLDHRQTWACFVPNGSFALFRKGVRFRLKSGINHFYYYSTNWVYL